MPRTPSRGLCIQQCPRSRRLRAKAVSSRVYAFKSSHIQWQLLVAFIDDYAVLSSFLGGSDLIFGHYLGGLNRKRAGVRCRSATDI